VVEGPAALPGDFPGLSVSFDVVAPLETSQPDVSIVVPLSQMEMAKVALLHKANAVQHLLMSFMQPLSGDSLQEADEAKHEEMREIRHIEAFVKQAQHYLPEMKKLQDLPPVLLLKEAKEFAHKFLKEYEELQEMLAEFKVNLASQPQPSPGLSNTSWRHEYFGKWKPVPPQAVPTGQSPRADDLLNISPISVATNASPRGVPAVAWLLPAGSASGGIPNAVSALTPTPDGMGNLYPQFHLPVEAGLEAERTVTLSQQTERSSGGGGSAIRTPIPVDVTDEEPVVSPVRAGRRPQSSASSNSSESQSSHSRRSAGSTKPKPKPARWR